jgi:hypothetical protein
MKCVLKNLFSLQKSQMKWDCSNNNNKDWLFFLDIATEIVEHLQQQGNKPQQPHHYGILLQYYYFTKKDEMVEKLFQEAKEKNFICRSIVLTILSHYTKFSNIEKVTTQHTFICPHAQSLYSFLFRSLSFDCSFIYSALLHFFSFCLSLCGYTYISFWLNANSKQCEELLSYFEKKNYVFIVKGFYSDFVTLLRVANQHKNYPMLIFWLNKLQKKANPFRKCLSSGYFSPLFSFICFFLSLSLTHTHTFIWRSMIDVFSID